MAVTRYNMENDKNKEKVSELYDLVVKEGFSELEYKNGGFFVRLKRRQKKSSTGPAQPLPGTPQPALNAIKAPLNGTLYRSLSPQQPPFVQEGDVVEQGAVLCVIEAMKVMNEIRSESRLRIVRILVENGRSVNAGQDIFLFENQ